MKPSNLFILTILWVLVSCTGLGNMPAMENASSSNCNNITPPEEEETFINNKYLSLLDIVERMRVYNIEEQANIFHHPVFSEVNLMHEDWVKQAKDQFQYREEFLELLYNSTLNLLTGKENIDAYLYFLLRERFIYLEAKSEQIEDYLKHDYNEADNIFPTNKAFYDFVIQDQNPYIYNKYKDINEIIRSHLVNKFQLLNLLIRESFLKCTLDELSHKTIGLLRASVQLHPILTGERKDLSHPDEAGGPYALLQPLIFPDLRNSKETLPTLLQGYSIVKNDILHIDSLYENSSLKLLVALNSLLINKRLYHVQLASFFFTNQNKINQELLTLKKELDLDTYKAHFVLKEQIFQFKNIGTPSGKAHQIRGGFTDYEAGKWPYELPNPDFLKKPQEEVLSKQPISPGSTLQHKGKDNQEKKLTSSAKGALKNKKKRNKLDETKQADEHADSIKESKQEEKDQVEEPKELGITLNNPIELAQQVRDEGEIQEALSELESGIIPPTNLEETIEGGKQEIQEMLASNFSFIRDWVLPRGLRSFHSQMLTYQYSKQTLNNQYQDTVDRLFDPQKQCNVSYREFKTLWKAVEGQIISNHGGSHRELIGPRQEKLFGIFAHSNNQTYGNGCVKYLQTAVLYVGLRPSRWM
jgi:hypothetical protein